MGRARRIAAIAAALVAASVGLAGSARGTGSLPLVGANYEWFALDSSCDLTGRGIVRDGADHRPLIVQQLAAMRASGIQSLRLIVWHMHDATGQQWGVVDSADGRLAPSARRNLTWFAQQVRQDGFKELDIAFSPQWTNSPYPASNYDSSLFDENWHFIQDVRAVVKRNGPSVTHFDLLNEGSPSHYLPTVDQVALANYIEQLYTDYVRAYGNDDVTISSIVDGGSERIAYLVDLLRATGEPLPRWFEVHTASSDILADLRAVDAQLSSDGLGQPINLGETYYDDAQAAAAVASFVGTATRGITEAGPWPFRRGAACSAGVSPPYQARQLIQALTGAAPSSTLTAAAATGALSVKTPSGGPATAIEAGDWTIAVTVLDTHTQFSLRGPGVDLTTAPGFTGTVQWPVTLVPGTYSYRRTGRPGWGRNGTFTVLAPG